jgi:methylated-DNA-[protein]-cysteine S-methyltransferase
LLRALTSVKVLALIHALTGVNCRLTVRAYVSFATAIGRVAVSFAGDGSSVRLLGIALPAQTDAATVRHLATGAQRLGFRGPLTAVTLDEAPPAVRDAARAITAHLAGETGPGADLASIALQDDDLSPFRQRVYREARRIPRGELASYAELAALAGSPRAARAVGRAMATNPWPIVVPCHRVVSAEGELHGFSAPGGTRTKAALLQIEGYSAPSTPARREGGAEEDARQVALPFDCSD